MKLVSISMLALCIVIHCVTTANAWTSKAVKDDALVRMPGTQPKQGVNLQGPAYCVLCHGEEETDEQGHILVPGFSWTGSMMAQAARDPLFWASITVAAQDSIWALGNPNAVDLCERCHFPEGWLEGRSDPPNASRMIGSDFDGVYCDFCHRMWDPFFETTFNGKRESNDWTGYWDEAGNTGPGSGTPSQNLAELTYAEDATLAAAIKLFSGNSFFQGNVPTFNGYTENANGQYFVSTDNGLVRKRASFADILDHYHTVRYSRYHKSKYFCSTCHDVSNPALANLNFQDNTPGDPVILPTEENSPYSYWHVERTWSEFMLSAYGGQGGAETNPEFQAQGAPTIMWAAKCQDCHMRDVRGKGSKQPTAHFRPDDSAEHPNSGAPLHDQQGGNLWITWILATLDAWLPDTYDAFNAQLLMQGPSMLTVDMSAGLSPTVNGAALLAASERAKQQLKLAATIKNLSYDPATGNLSFRIQNNTGHKLISGFPEGRRMFVNIKAYAAGSLIYDVNPYDYACGTLKGPEFCGSQALLPNEAYMEELVYEVHPRSGLTGENEKTFHFVLATGRYKDNRIPPKGFDITNAAARICEPVWHGTNSINYFTTEEYAGGYDEVHLAGDSFPSGADRVEVALYYQGTSREYIEFLRDEINGTAHTLSEPTPSEEAQAYIIQTDPSGFFNGLKAWGNTIWDLWYHNHGLDGQGASVPGIVPFEMTKATWGGPPAVISKLGPRVVESGTSVKILGSALGDTQGDSVIHLGPRTFDSSSTRIKLWTDTKIRIRIPNYSCAWFQGKDFRRVNIWVTVNGMESNKMKLKVLKLPTTCP
jgi:cytochrome c553